VEICYGWRLAEQPNLVVSRYHPFTVSQSTTSFPTSIHHVCVPCLHYGWSLYRWRCYWLRQNAIYSFARGRCQVRPIRGTFHRRLYVSSLLTKNQSVGLLYLWSAAQIHKGAPNGLEGAMGKRANLRCMWVDSLNGWLTGASAILLLSSLPRITKGSVPAVLAATATVSGAYYGNTFYALRRQ
jgi:uncharacterized membrane protein (UPF0136 family)